MCTLDVDECTANVCHNNSSCNDTFGSYLCICNAGFTGNEFNCSGKHFLITVMISEAFLFVYDL